MCRPSPRCSLSASCRSWADSFSEWKVMTTCIAYNAGVLEPLKLPEGIHIEQDEEGGSIDLFNATDRIVQIDNVGGRRVILYPGERHCLITGGSMNCTITGRRYQRPSPPGESR